MEGSNIEFEIQVEEGRKRQWRIKDRVLKQGFILIGLHR